MTQSGRHVRRQDGEEEPVGALLVVLEAGLQPAQVGRRLLQLLHQLALGSTRLRDEDQVARRVVQRDVAEEEAPTAQVVGGEDARRSEQQEAVRLAHVHHLSLEAQAGGGAGRAALVVEAQRRRPGRHHEHAVEVVEDGGERRLDDGPHNGEQGWEGERARPAGGGRRAPHQAQQGGAGLHHLHAPVEHHVERERAAERGDAERQVGGAGAGAQPGKHADERAAAAPAPGHRRLVLLRDRQHRLLVRRSPVHRRRRRLLLWPGGDRFDEHAHVEELERGGAHGAHGDGVEVGALARVVQQQAPAAVVGRRAAHRRRPHAGAERLQVLLQGVEVAEEVEQVGAERAQRRVVAGGEAVAEQVLAERLKTLGEADVCAVNGHGQRTFCCDTFFHLADTSLVPQTHPRYGSIIYRFIIDTYVGWPTMAYYGTMHDTHA